MTIRLSDLLNSTYGSVTEYHYDLSHAEGDGVVIQAIEDKLARSMPTITGAQPAPQANRGPLSATIAGDQTYVGTPAAMANGRNTRLNESSEANEQLAGSFSKFRSVIVKQ